MPEVSVSASLVVGCLVTGYQQHGKLQVQTVPRMLDADQRPQ